MKRREFVQRMSALAPVIALGGCFESNGTAPAVSLATDGDAGPADSLYDLDSLFPRYTGFDPLVPVHCVTPDIDRCIHRFHLSSPFSPSGRYLGLTRLSREDRPPEPGEPAEIVLVDLQTGEQKVIAETIGWDTQLGAQVQWGATDRELLFNDVDPSTWMPFGVVMDPLTGAKRNLDGTVYSVSPDGKWAASTCLRRIGATQAGYGVIIPRERVPVNNGAVDDDGVYVTDTVTGESRMVASYKRIVEEAVPAIDVARYGPGDFYGFHVKWNAYSDRLMVVVRYMPHDNPQRKPMLVTMTRDGGDIRVAVPATEWADKGGNHPNWDPDGEHVLMNLDIDGDGWMFVQARYDGTDLRKLTSVPGNRGHVSMHPDRKYLLTDAYPHEDASYGDGTSPLWLIDLEKHEKTTLARMDSVTPFFDDAPNTAKAMRVDFHPAWDRRTCTHVAFNGTESGTRRVYVADLSAFVG
jgi:hypothetical protein